MFGYVKQELYEAERAARKAAETEQRRMEEEIRFLSATCKGHETRILDLCDERDALRLTIREFPDAQLKATALLLQHIAPLQTERSSPEPDQEPRKPLTYEQIMSEPASTKREMFLRELRANAAREAQYSEVEREALRIRLAHLTPEEREANRADGVFDATLGITVPAEKAEEKADHVN